MWVPILSSPILLSNILSSMSCIFSSEKKTVYISAVMLEKIKEAAKDEQRIGTVSFKESDPLGQQSTTVKHGLQPKAASGITDMIEPGCSLPEHTQFLYFKCYTQSRIRLMLAQC